jgi:hypothetical protein
VLLGSQGVVNALLVNSLLLSLGAAGLSLVAAVLAFSRDERRLGYAAVGMVFAMVPIGVIYLVLYRLFFPR